MNRSQLAFGSGLNRREWLSTTAAGAGGLSIPGWFRGLAAAADVQRPFRNCILLWMGGGPSQLDTFDVKPGHENGGPLQPIDTSVPGIQISEHLPNLARQMQHLAIIRSMSTREGDHGRATDHLRTGYLPQASIQFPVLGSVVSHERPATAGDLPNYVSVFPRGLFRAGISPSGFLGADHAPLIVGSADGQGTLRVENAASPKEVSAEMSERRLRILGDIDSEFLASRSGAGTDAHHSAYSRGLKLMSPAAREAFDLEREPAEIREQYGVSSFGRGCLLARRLVERSVPFVEVSLGGWDTHQNNFDAVKALCSPLDQGMSALIADLQVRGLLDSTLIVWMGEFGRTPTINPQSGRDHYPKAWSTVLAGGGIRGGQVFGKTSADGMSVIDRKVSVPDFLATVCKGIGLDPRKQNMSNVARPIRLVDPEGKVIEDVLTST
jgi:hypothetical protein